MKSLITSELFIISILLIFLLQSLSLKMSTSRITTRSTTKMITSETIKVSSYNVLSSHLASPSHFTSCKAEYLDTNYRLKKIQEKLTNEMNEEAIICLQEISHYFTGKLHGFFTSNNYHLITACYGNKFNNYMGVGIAIPLNKYSIEDVNITRIVDTKKMPKPIKLLGLQKYIHMIKLFFSSIFTTFGQWLGLIKPKIDFWDNVMYRSNQMICTRLKQKNLINNKEFVIGTYHMPCMFKLPGVMITHCALSTQHIRNYSNSLPFIYTGDFNIKPNSSQYELLTTGKIDKNHPDYPEPVPGGDDWVPDVQPMRSAYVVKEGKEPDFTNYAKVRDDPTFIETLDYMFLSDEWNVSSVSSLPHRDDIEGPLPNKDEPSDHILISANFTLP